MSGLGDIARLPAIDLEALARPADEARLLERARERTDEAATAFQTVFTRLFVREMRRSLDVGLFDGSGADTYSAWFDEHVGDVLAERDALGLAGMVKAAIGAGAQEPQP